MLATETAPASSAGLDLSRVQDLYAKGLCLQAYREAEKIKPLRAWRGLDRILAGRIAYNLGAPKFAVVAHSRAFREAPENAEARYYQARALLERQGPLRAWRFLRESGELPEAEAWNRADWLSFHAHVLGRLRDFDAADLWFGRAELLAPQRPWIFVEQSYLLEMEDRVPEALEATKRALELRPWYRPGVQSKAHLLQQLARDRDAIELLQQAADRIESVPVLAQLGAIQTELRRYHDAQRTYERFAEQAVLLEKKFAEWLAARRSDTAYYCGDCAAAADWAKQVHEPFFEKVAEQLSRTPLEGQRVLLEVGFVRQNFQTCAPATLAAIGRYWKMPVDHLDVAAEICYDGTPDHRERFWAEEHGWMAREFTVTWDSARALLDRGVPFTLTTAEAVSAHLQAVIGYDSRRGTLLIREPSLRNFTEFIAETLFERCRSTGPRGMALVPVAEAGRFDGLTLLDSELYDRQYRLQRALHVHERAQAEQIYRELEAVAPGHRLTWQARRQLAAYDGDLQELLVCAEELLKLYPDDSIFLLAKLHHLRELARRDERIALLSDICGKPKTDPVFYRQYAQELSVDARVHEHTSWLVKRAMRFRPWDAGNYATLANVRWDQRRFEEGMELYRMAACLDDKDEGLARSFFLSSRHLRQTDEGLRFLEKRNERFGAQSSLPPRTLHWAYSVLERSAEANAMLEQALARRPDDGDLMLFAADVAAGQGEFARADELVKRAAGRSAQANWLRTSANLETSRGEPARSLALWQQVLEGEPLAVDANRAVARLLAETDSRQAALDHLRRACERFPHNFNLHQGLIEWLRDDGAQALEPVVRRIIAIHPADAWARRELALTLADQRRFDEAFVELDEAERLEPTTTTYFGVRAQVLERAGRGDEAQAAYRQAIEHSVDNDFAIARLMQGCGDHAERRAALAFVEQELAKQVVFGDGLLAFQTHAQGTLEPEELLDSLRRAHAARADLWHAWSALVTQLCEVHKLDEALDVARQASERFPLLPRVWLDLASVHGARKEREAEIAAVQRALQLNPSWGAAVRHLAELHDRAGELPRARELLERGVQSTPLDPLHHGCLADILWRLEEKEAALASVQKALQLDPGYQWGWSALRDWSNQLQRPELPGQIARDLTVRRGGEARSWLLLADNLEGPDALAERQAALDRALELNPHSVEAFDKKAEILGQLGSFDEALALCRPGIFGDDVPMQLQARAAWLEAQRGRLDLAIAGIQRCTQLDPNNYRYREMLADWQRQTGATEPYLATARELVRIAPNYAVAHAYLGDAFLQTDATTEGKSALRRALELDPRYELPALLLFDVSLFEKDFDGCEEMLAKLRANIKGEVLHRREVQLAVARQDREAARAAFAELCGQPVRESIHLERATGAMCDAGWLEDARNVLESAPDCHLHATGFLADLQWRMNDREAALANIQDAVRKTPSEDWPWGALRDWSRQLECPEVAADLARELAEEQDDSAYLWLQVARCLQDEDDLEERLAALDRVLELEPKNVDAYECRAEALAEADRIDEARAACHPKIFGKEVPAQLLAREACIDQQRGSLDEAIAGMQRLVAREPEQYRYRELLADWQCQAGKIEDYHASCLELVKLAPQYSKAHGYLGDALLQLDKPEEAKLALQRSLEIDPGYVFPALLLFDLSFASKDLAKAEEMLALLQEHLGGPLALRREVQLATARSDRVRACKAFAALCGADQPDMEQLDRAAAAFEEAGWSADARNLLAQAIDNNPEPSTDLIDYWVERALDADDWSCLERIEQLVDAGAEGGLEALAAYAHGLAKKGRRAEFLELVKRHREELRSTDGTWSQVGSSFGRLNDYEGAIAWMSDWQERGEAPCHALLNHSLDLRELGKHEAARRVNEAAIASSNPGYTTPFNHVWLAMEYVLEGNSAAARDQLEAAGDEADDYHLYYALLVEALLSVQEAPPGQRASLFDAARSRFAAARATYPELPHKEGLLPTYQRCVQRLAELCGGLRARLWAWWRCSYPDVPAYKE